jgi:hypothetical protein
MLCKLEKMEKLDIGNFVLQAYPMIGDYAMMSSLNKMSS